MVIRPLVVLLHFSIILFVEVVKKQNNRFTLTSAEMAM